MPEDEQRGLIGLARSIVGMLPPAFLMLLLINTAFLALVFWFIDSQLEQRMALLNRIIDHCFLTKLN